MCEVENRAMDVKLSNNKWEQPIDWDQRVNERKERLEKGENASLEQLEKQNRKENGGELCKLCRKYLEQNDISETKYKKESGNEKTLKTRDSQK